MSNSTSASLSASLWSSTSACNCGVSLPPAASSSKLLIMMHRSTTYIDAEKTPLASAFYRRDVTVTVVLARAAAQAVQPRRPQASRSSNLNLVSRRAISYVSPLAGQYHSTVMDIWPCVLSVDRSIGMSLGPPLAAESRSSHWHIRADTGHSGSKAISGRPSCHFQGAAHTAAY